MVTIDIATAGDIHALALSIAGQMDAKSAEIILNLGNPVEWTNAERLDVMKWLTEVAYILALDVACYPLSKSAVVFFP